jgi:hypothetical protein
MPEINMLEINMAVNKVWAHAYPIITLGNPRRFKRTRERTRKSTRKRIGKNTRKGSWYS